MNEKLPKMVQNNLDLHVFPNLEFAALFLVVFIYECPRAL
jgi:hypothetical protein